MKSCPECGKFFSFRGSVAVTAERKIAQHCSMSHRPSTCNVCLKEFFGSGNKTGEMKLSQHMASTGHCTSRATCPRS
eukprot:scaffold5019_cov131-Skeletonema_dohrnii-CCMP3373.AAC.8